MRLDLQWGRDGVNSHLCPGAVAGYMFLPGHLCALVPCNVPQWGGWFLAWCWCLVSVLECLYGGEGGLWPWGACTVPGVRLFLLK